jgi:hypothetical protein
MKPMNFGKKHTFREALHRIRPLNEIVVDRRIEKGGKNGGFSPFKEVGRRKNGGEGEKIRF